MRQYFPQTCKKPFIMIMAGKEKTMVIGVSRKGSHRGRGAVQSWFFLVLTSATAKTLATLVLLSLLGPLHSIC